MTPIKMERFDGSFGLSVEGSWMEQLDGFLNLAKPAGMTSHDCVARVRWLLKQALKDAASQAQILDSATTDPQPRQSTGKSGKIKPPKVGHGGTLDPAAIGVLPIAIGRATRLLQYLPGTKAYRGTVRFGLTTRTDDLDGDILTQEPASHLTLDQIQPHLDQFLGKIEQIPPQYSAIQVDGKRLYDLARRDQLEQVEVPRRHVEVYRLEVVEWRSGEYPELVLEIVCGAGTYIRSIARDLGQILGVGATLAALTRTQSAGLPLTGSLDLDTIATQVQQHTLALLPPAQLLSHLPRVQLQPAQAQDWNQGKRLAWEAVVAPLEPAPLEPAPPSMSPGQLASMQESDNRPSQGYLDTLQEKAILQVNTLQSEDIVRPGNRVQPDTLLLEDTPLRVETATGQFLGVGTYRLGAYGYCLQPKVVWGES